MMQVYINNAKIFAFHGVHKEERLSGGWFSVDVYVDFIPSAHPITGLNETVDYTELLKVVNDEMSQPKPLLETVAGLTAKRILAQFSIVEEVKISITKLKPPIAAFNGSVGVSLTLNRSGL